MFAASASLSTKIIPDDALLLRSIYRHCNELSQRPGWKQFHISVLGARVLALCTIPVAALHTVNYATRGILQVGVEVLNGNITKAGSIVRKEGYATLESLALVVASVAYAALGLVLGSIIFKQVVPELAVPNEQQDEKHELRQRLEALQATHDEVKRVAAAKELEMLIQMTVKLADLEQKINKISPHPTPAPPESPRLDSDQVNDLQIKDFCLLKKSDVTEQELNWYDLIVKISANMYKMVVHLPSMTAKEAISVIRKAIKHTSSVFVDIKKDPWKAERYRKSSQTLAKAFGNHSIQALKQYETQNNDNPIANSITKNVRLAMDALTIPGLNEKASRQFDSFQQTLCRGLIQLENGGHNLGSSIVTELNRLSHDFFTKINFLSFYTKLVYYVAASKNPEICTKLGLDGSQATPLSLCQKLEMIFHALPKNGSDLTAPVAHVIAAKLGVWFSSFDPLHDSNIPTVLVKKVHTSMDGSKPALETTHFRTGVPIGPKDIATKSKPWEVDKSVTFVPEYEAFLEHLKSKKEKLLVILHLDPLYLDEVANGFRGPKSREALWIQMYIELAKSEKYRGTIELALLPLDGNWLEGELEGGYDKNGKNIHQLDDFVNWLTDVVTREKSPFIIPASVGDKHAFVKKVAEATRARYFPKIGDQSIILDTLEARQAFLGFFQGVLAEALQIQTGAHKVQRNCKDAVDRTMSLVGVEMLHDGSLLKQLDDNTFHENIIGSVFGASLANVKRRIIGRHRFQIFLNSLKHFDWLRKMKVELGPMPQFNGYQLSQLEFPTDPTMSLYAEPAQVSDEKGYSDLLQFEAEHPYTLPSKLPLPTFDVTKMSPEQAEVRAWEEIHDFLKKRYENPKLNISLAQKDKPEYVTLADQMIIKRSFSIQKDAKKLGEIKVEFTIPQVGKKLSHYSYKVTTN